MTELDLDELTEDLSSEPEVELAKAAARDPQWLMNFISKVSLIIAVETNATSFELTPEMSIEDQEVLEHDRIVAQLSFELEGGDDDE